MRCRKALCGAALAILLATGGAAAADEACRLFPGRPGFVDVAVDVTLLSTGALDTTFDITFTACVDFREWRIDQRRSRLDAAYAAELLLGRSGHWTQVEAESVTEDHTNPPVSGGGPELNFVYALPAVGPGDQLRGIVRRSSAPVFASHQFAFESMPSNVAPRHYRVTFRSERPDYRVRLVDPSRFLRHVVDAPDRQEWVSTEPFLGSLKAGIRLELMTLDTWEKVAREFRKAYFLDQRDLSQVEALGIAPSSDANALFDEFTRRLSTMTVIESRYEPRDLASILATHGGDCKSLTFAFLNLLRRNGIDAELVLSTMQHGRNHRMAADDVLSLGNIDHVIVYVPALDRYFDPTFSERWEQASLDQVVRGTTRLHVAAPAPRLIDHANACSDACVRQPF